jgi:peroxiredoxin
MSITATLIFGFGIVVSAAPNETVQVVREFSLLDTQQRKHTIKEWAAAKAVVLFFISADCPASNGYAPDIAGMVQTFAEKDVLFYGVHSDPDLTAEQASAHAKEYKLNFPILLDPAQSLASQSGVKRVPTAVVLSADGKVLYRGRIDDRYISLGKKRSEPTRRDTLDALDQVLAGKAPTTPQTEVIGCLLPKITEGTGRKPK